VALLLLPKEPIRDQQNKPEDCPGRARLRT
jgi:hypothetical protein